MAMLWIGLLLFGGIHLFIALFPAARTALKARLGEGPWKGLFSLVSLAGLALIIWSYIRLRNGDIETTMAYIPGAGAKHITMTLALLAFILWGSGHGKGYIRLWVQNPMSVGFVLWAVGHLLANGKTWDVAVFGTILVIALVDIIVSMLRGKRPSYEPRLRSDIIAVAAGVVLYAVFLFGFHPYVLGLPVV
ncbi:NnrU family protein [Aestuariivirga sp.]|uniref:NnrU family protein n=1 Tax=Aestuariivirga sp. TaxID=2650926 RepID=UPI0039E680E0